MVFLGLGIIVFLLVIFNAKFLDLLKQNLLAIVIISTSVVTGAFIVIRLYVISQISIREVEMMKNFEQLSSKITEDFKEMRSDFKEMRSEIREDFKEMKKENEKEISQLSQIAETLTDVAEKFSK